MEGTAKPVFYQGTECGQTVEYSDSLLMFLIKERRPEYREHHKVEHTGAGGAPLTLKVEFVKPE
jgi:hypothetical protein